MTAEAVSNGFKRATIIVHDLVATALALAGSLFLRYHMYEIGAEAGEIAWMLPTFVAIAGIVYRVFPLYESKWRFASLPDLFNIFRAASVLALLLLAVDYALVARGLYPALLFGEKTVVIYWMMQMILLGGPRLAYRYLKYVQSRRPSEGENQQSILVLGRITEAEVVLRALETGMRRRFAARGILSPRRSDQGQSIRGVPVFGGYAELERIVSEFKDRDQPITRLVLAPSEFVPEAESELLMVTAARLGIALTRLQTVEEGSPSTALKPVNIEDLLFRETVDVDRVLLGSFLAGKRVIVTGGGGSIGSEICSRVVAFGASELLVLDSSEPGLYAVLEKLAPTREGCRIVGKIADVRDRPRIMAVFTDFRPDVVFHAAALKQVPFLELDWAEGIKTNVFGSVNVADAAAQTAGAAVLISTDKAVDPVSVLGATKRFSEIYAQLVDAEAGAARRDIRLISVRFGNVLGSVGSVVPRFKAQIERGGPVTVTHPDMVRYFMTVREACDLVLTASAHATGDHHAETDRVSVYVLKMGQPARIVELAQRMIRLAGFEPGRDIEITFTGVRKGERLNELMFTADEPVVDIGVEGVTAARTFVVERPRMARWLESLKDAVEKGDRAAADRIFAEAIPSFRKIARDVPTNIVDLATARAQT